MTNADNLIAGLSEWLTRVAASVLPKVNIPTNSGIGKAMQGLLGINPAQYNLWNELGFLLTPTVRGFIEPQLKRYLSAIPDESIKDMAMSYVDSFIAQAREKGYVNLFGVQLGANAFEGLKDILNQKFNVTNIRYDDTRTESPL
jgi:hypothetical protein